MQRQIEFRGKCLNNGEWVYGYYAYIGVKSKNGEMEMAHVILNMRTNDAESLTWSIVDPSTVGQFTGLVDKNGKRIYEFDIIKGHEWERGKSHRHIGIVEYISSSFKSVGINKYLGFHGSVDGSYEVINNIFDKEYE